MNRERDKATGQFKTDTEPNSVNLVVRISPSLRKDIEIVSGGKVADWVRATLTSQVEQQARKIN